MYPLRRPPPNCSRRTPRVSCRVQRSQIGHDKAPVDQRAVSLSVAVSIFEINPPARAAYTTESSAEMTMPRASCSPPISATSCPEKSRTSMELYNKPTEKNTCLCVESTTIWVTPTEFERYGNLRGDLRRVNSGGATGVACTARRAMGRRGTLHGGDSDERCENKGPAGVAHLKSHQRKVLGPATSLSARPPQPTRHALAESDCGTSVGDLQFGD